MREERGIGNRHGQSREAAAGRRAENGPTCHVRDAGGHRSRKRQKGPPRAPRGGLKLVWGFCLRSYRDISPVEVSPFVWVRRSRQAPWPRLLLRCLWHRGCSGERPEGLNVQGAGASRHAHPGALCPRGEASTRPLPPPAHSGPPPAAHMPGDVGGWTEGRRQDPPPPTNTEPGIRRDAEKGMGLRVSLGELRNKTDFHKANNKKLLHFSFSINLHL